MTVNTRRSDRFEWGWGGGRAAETFVRESPVSSISSSLAAEDCSGERCGRGRGKFSRVGGSSQKKQNPEEDVLVAARNVKRDVQSC